MITIPSFNLTIFVNKRRIILAVIHRTKNIKYIKIDKALITMGHTWYVLCKGMCETSVNIFEFIFHEKGSPEVTFHAESSLLECKY